MSTFDFNGSGEVYTSGSSNVFQNFNVISFGDTEVSGNYTLSITTISSFSGSGGIEISGSYDDLNHIDINGSGIIKISGNSTDNQLFNFNAKGGIICSGSVESTVTQISCVILSGKASVTAVYGINGSGLVEVSGNSKDSQVRFFNSYGEIDVSGIGKAVRNVVVKGSGGILNSGKSESNIIFNPTCSGGVNVGGNSKDRILFYSSSETLITYDLGDLPLYAYRVTGYCQPLNCDTNPFSDPQSTCGHQIVNYILARNLADICTQLKNNGTVFTIKAVYKYDKAVFGIDNLNDIQNELVDPNCPKFVDVTDDFCLQTECFEFCLNADALFLAKGVFSADIYVPYKANAQINLSGGHKITKASAYSFSAISNNTLIGNAAASGNNLLPNVAFTGSGSQKLLVTSNTYCSYLGEFPTYGYGDLTVELVGIDTTGGEGLILEGDLENPVANICGCKTLLNYVDFQSNLLTKTSVFSDFIYRNRLTVNKNLRLYYNQRTKTFFNAVKYDGLSTSSSDTESWNIVVELACTNQLSRFNQILWNFSLFVSKKTYGSNNALKSNLESRFFVYIPVPLLYTNTKLLEFDFQVDMKNLVVYDKFKQIIYDLQPRLTKDNLKLFQSGDWVSNPFLNLFVYSLTTQNDLLFRPNKNAQKINILPLVQSP